MATAEHTTVEVLVSTTEPRVVLTMTEEEAKTLRALTRFVSGDPRTTVRKHTNSIHDALSRAGIHSPNDYLGPRFRPDGTGVKGLSLDSLS